MTPAEAMQYLAREVEALKQAGKPARSAKMEEVRALIHALSKASKPGSTDDFVDDFIGKLRGGR